MPNAIDRLVAHGSDEALRLAIIRLAGAYKARHPERVSATKTNVLRIDLREDKPK